MLLLLDPTVQNQTVNTTAPIEPLRKPKSSKKIESIDRSKTDSATNEGVEGCMPEKVTPLPPGNPAEILIGLLRGTQELFKNPDARPKVTSKHDSDTGDKRVIFKTVAAHSSRVPPQDIGSLLDDYCKPYTYYRRAKLTLGVDVAWTIYRDDAEKRLSAIWWTISKLGCADGSDPGILANELA
jgi:hypothetical protein